MKNQISRTLKFTACAILGFGLAAHAQSRLSVAPASGGTFATFNVPGAGTHANQGTIPRAMNASGAATGYYIDNSNVFHGFKISLDGNIETFDAPGAGTGPNQGTQPYDINGDGTIVGFVYDNSGIRHGFQRAPDGSFKNPPPDHPLDSINAVFQTAGFELDANGAAHAYVGNDNADVSEAGTGNGQGTFLCPGCLNDAGDATGHYIDSNNVPHAFVRWADGTIETFLKDPGEAGWASKIDNLGRACGYSLDANNAKHGFIRNHDGSMVAPIDAPLAGTGSGQGTWAYSINDFGVVFGYYIDSANISHGFVRSVRGTYRVLDAPGAGTVRGGTLAQKIINSGLVVGNYVDNNLVQHGYYWISPLP